MAEINFCLVASARLITADPARLKLAAVLMEPRAAAIINAIWIVE
jgi:hypothetical protein